MSVVVVVAPIVDLDLLTVAVAAVDEAAAVVVAATSVVVVLVHLADHFLVAPCQPANALDHCPS